MKAEFVELSEEYFRARLIDPHPLYQSMCVAIDDAAWRRINTLKFSDDCKQAIGRAVGLYRWRREHAMALIASANAVARHADDLRTSLVELLAQAHSLQLTYADHGQAMVARMLGLHEELQWVGERSACCELILEPNDYVFLTDLWFIADAHTGQPANRGKLWLPFFEETYDFAAEVKPDPERRRRIGHGKIQTLLRRVAEVQRDPGLLEELLAGICLVEPTP